MDNPGAKTATKTGVSFVLNGAPVLVAPETGERLSYALRERLGAPLLGSVPRVAGSNPAAAASFLELPPVT